MTVDLSDEFIDRTLRNTERLVTLHEEPFRGFWFLVLSGDPRHTIVGVKSGSIARSNPER